MEKLLSRLLRRIQRELCMGMFLVLAIGVHGQNLFVKVGATYGVSAADDNKRVSDKYAAGQDTLPTGLYWAWQRWKVEGMPYATFRTRYLGCAIAKDIAWKYEAPDNIKKGYQNTFAFADWTDASGHWYANATMQIPRGGMLGQGSFGYWDDGQTSQIFATCEFEMTEDWWPANQTERRLFEAPNGSLSTPDNGSYNESFRIEGFRLQGPAIYGDGIIRIGIFIRRPGECSYMNQVNVSSFQYGILIAGSVPFTFGTLTAFWNEIAGVALMGGWGSTFVGQCISGDSNGELFGSRAGYGDEGGGIIKVDLLKHEEGILEESAEAPYRGGNAVYIEGQYAATFGAINFSNKFVTADAMVVINPRTKVGDMQRSTLNVCGAKGFGYRTLIHNVATGERVECPADYAASIFRHYAYGNRYVVDDQVVTPTTCRCPPLGFYRGNGPFDYVACTPARVGGVVVPPPNQTPCTGWYTGPWIGNCNNGTEDRFVYELPQGCTGTPPGTRPPAQRPCTPAPTIAITSSPAKMEGSDGNPPVLRPLGAAVDGNTSNYWLSGRAMAIGQYVIMDLGTARSVKSVTFPIPPGYLNSYPRRFDVATATGTQFTNRATGVVGGAVSTATWGAVNARYIRITVREANPNWWGTTEFRIE